MSSPRNLSSNEDQLKNADASATLPTEFNNKIHIFVPVAFDDIGLEKKYKNNHTIYLAKLNGKSNEDFRKTINLKDFAKLLTSRSAKYVIQIGLTEKEAHQIVNQHSHVETQLIVEVNIPVLALTEKKQSEKDRFPDILNAKTIPHFWLLKNTLIKPDDIVAVSAMQMPLYLNTRRFNLRPSDYWPENFRLVTEPLDVQSTNSKLLSWLSIFNCCSTSNEKDVELLPGIGFVIPTRKR